MSKEACHIFIHLLSWVYWLIIIGKYMPYGMGTGMKNRKLYNSNGVDICVTKRIKQVNK